MQVSLKRAIQHACYDSNIQTSVTTLVWWLQHFKGTKYIDYSSLLRTQVVANSPLGSIYERLHAYKDVIYNIPRQDSLHRSLSSVGCWSQIVQSRGHGAQVPMLSSNNVVLQYCLPLIHWSSGFLCCDDFGNTTKPKNTDRTTFWRTNMMRGLPIQFSSTFLESLIKMTRTHPVLGLYKEQVTSYTHFA